MMNRRTLLAASLASTLASTLASPHIARAAARKMRLGHNNSATSPIQFFGEAFKKATVEMSGGALDFELFPSSQLGNDTQLIKSTAEGTIDATISGSSVLSALFEDFGFSEIPYMFKDFADAHKAFDGALGSHLKEGLGKAGIFLAGWGESGFRHVTSTRAVRTPADMKDMKIRVQPAKLQVESFRAFGAAPEAIAFSELPEALKIGRVIAQENPTGIIAANDFLYKLQSHVSLTRHVYSPFILSVSADVVAEMSAEHRDIITKAGIAAAKASRELAQKSEEANIERLKSLGMTIVNDVDIAAFQKVMTEHKDRIASAVGADGYNRIRSLIA